MNRYNPLGELDLILKRASTQPGPGYYRLDTLDIAKEAKTGGSFNRTKHLTLTEEVAKKAELFPGPGQYEPQKIEHSSSAFFDNSGGVRYIDLVVKKASETPGPGAHMKTTTPTEAKSMKDLNRYFGCRPSSI
jgi:hypothetical protein